MKLLIFEYSTCVDNSNLISEGFGILKSILEDLEEDNNYDVDYLLMKNLDIEHIEKSNRIVLDEDLLMWLDKNASGYDYSLFVAPEDNLIQYKITKILEQKNVKLLTSNSDASYTCSSKYLTYQKTPDDILKIPSIIIDTSYYDHDLLDDKINKNDVVCKPDNYTSSNYIYHTNKDNIKQIITEYKNNKIEKMLIQEYIQGTPISISAITANDEINILSINSQIIKENDNNLSYTGCICPIDHPLEKQIKDISVKIIKSIPGLKGFVGIDYIISDDKIYFVEVNSRITTPYIVLHNISNRNLTKYLIDSMISNHKLKSIKLNDKGDFFNEK